MGVVIFRRLVVIVAVLMVLGWFLPAYGAQKTAKDYISQGNEFLKANQAKEAYDSFTAALKLNPKSVDALNGRGVAYLKLGGIASALADFTQAIKLDPKNGKAYNNRAVLLWSLGQYDKAEEDIKKAQKLGIQISKETIERALGGEKPTEKESPPPAASQPGGLKPKEEAAAGPVRQFTPEERQGYQKQKALELAEINKRIEELKSHYQDAPPVYLRLLRRNFLMLQQRAGRVNLLLKALDDASDKDWPYNRIAVDSAMQDLIATYSDLASRLEPAGKAQASPDKPGQGNPSNPANQPQKE